MFVFYLQETYRKTSTMFRRQSSSKTTASSNSSSNGSITGTSAVAITTPVVGRYRLRKWHENMDQMVGVKTLAAYDHLHHPNYITTLFPVAVLQNIVIVPLLLTRTHLHKYHSVKVVWLPYKRQRHLLTRIVIIVLFSSNRFYHRRHRHDKGHPEEKKALTGH